MVGPNYSGSKYGHRIVSDNDTGNIEIGQKTSNIGSNHREESDSDSNVSEPLVDRSGWSNPQGNHKVFGTGYLETAAALVNQTPFDYYCTFIDEDVIYGFLRVLKK
ncbi:hypothetical protein JTB14_029825 [Gonioctena quinquepunctata]|nr:hypothetical protein JTB14_029825 [Gonioctena quinquepunctata]